MCYRFAKWTGFVPAEFASHEENTNSHGSSLPPLFQLLIAVRFYGAETFQLDTGDLVNVWQPLVCRAIGRGTGMIAATLQLQLVTVTKDDKMNAVMTNFHEMVGFPGVTRSIDCTHNLIF